MPQTAWTEHANDLAPLIKWIGGSLITVIVVMGTAFIRTLLAVGKIMANKFNAMDNKLDTMHQVMMMCDGCAHAAKEHKRRSTDLGD
jgi:hypothetical protein